MFKYKALRIELGLSTYRISILLIFVFAIIWITEFRNIQLILICFDILLRYSSNPFFPLGLRIMEDWLDPDSWKIGIKFSVLLENLTCSRNIISRTQELKSLNLTSKTKQKKI